MIRDEVVMVAGNLAPRPVYPRRVLVLPPQFDSDVEG